MLTFLANDSVLNESMNQWGGDLLDVRWIFFALSVLVLVMAGIYIYRRVHRAPGDAAPLITFNDVAGRLGLSWRGRWLLIRIARQQQLPTPLALLLAPGTLSHHTKRYAAAMQPGRRQRTIVAVNALGKSLYGRDWTPLEG